MLFFSAGGSRLDDRTVYSLSLGQVNHCKLRLGPAKVKIFSGPCYMMKCVLTFVSGVQESVLVDFISQSKAKILHKVKISQNCLHQKFPYKNEQIYIFQIFF